jgi:hypothetical protein
MIEAIPGSQEAFLAAIKTLNPVGPPVPPMQGPDQFGYYSPLKPDGQAPEGLQAFWKEILSISDLGVSETAIAVGDLRTLGVPVDPDQWPLYRTLQRKRTVPRPPRLQSSGNWSGASLSARDGRMFTDVMASWEIPSVKASRPGGEHDSYACSCWVGFDGQRSYSNSTLPQIGTEQTLNKPGGLRAEEALVWFQWWPMGQMEITNLPVQPKDRIYCWLSAVSKTRIRCLIKVKPGPQNSDKTVRTVRFFVDAPDVRYTSPDIEKYAPTIWGATAEWVTEAPTNTATGELQNVPNFTVVEFQQCYAISRTMPLDRDQRVEDLTSPRLIQMYKIENFRRLNISKVERPTDGLALDILRTAFVG